MGMSPTLSRYVSQNVTLLGDLNRPGGVSFAFTERTGGVSEGAYASLNLGSRCGDDPAAVAENRARALAALGAADIAGNLVEPKQVHGDHVVVVRGADAAELARAREEAQAGADAVVCTAPDVPVLLCFADCVPVVLTAPGAFAVIHSGWRGTLARISAKALGVLMAETGCEAKDVNCYVGPHILGKDYEVSEDLMATFTAEFGTIAYTAFTKSKLDLSAVIARTLEEAGLPASNLLDSCVSTATNLGRFYSYRAEGGICGRHAAIAYLGQGSRSR